MFNLIYESTTTNDGYDLKKPNRYINYMATIKELYAKLDEKELEYENISWGDIAVKCYALIDEWNNCYYENCHTNVVSNRAIIYSKKKYVFWECDNDTYQRILTDISDGIDTIVLSEYGINSASVKYSSKKW